MREKKKTAVSVTAALLALCVSCGKTPAGSSDGERYEYYDYTAVHRSADRNLAFYSSDKGLDDFLNDYRARHMRDGEDRIHTHPVGAGGTAWKEWESMIGSWWDTSSENGTMTSQYATQDWIRRWLITPKQDKQGYIWADEGTELASWAMGWQFPDYNQGGAMWDFTKEGDAEGWSVSGGNGEVRESCLVAVADGSSGTLEIISPETEIGTLVSPFLRMCFYFVPSGGCEIDDLYVYYKTEKSPEWSEDKKVSFSQFCTTGYEIGGNTAVRSGYFFPMYLEEQWGASARKRVTGIRLSLKAKEGKKVSGTFVLDYVGSDFDDRQPLNVCNYIIAAKKMCEYSRDTELLNAVLPRARRAMNFLLNQLRGKNGLIDTDYLSGHYNDGLKGTGTGLGNGYWDVLAFPKVNLYCNISYYNALNAMAYLEEMSGSYNAENREVYTVNAAMNGTDRYEETAESLKKLAETCKIAVRKTFWNEKTGRFHVGFRDEENTVQDHGYAMFNEQVVASGLATEEQTRSILSWLDGTRIVEGDNSKGEDIYRYEFAPRFNTEEIGSDFYFGYSASFDGNVQNGGTALHLAYYDLVARAARDKNDSFGRLKKIQSWYEKIKAAGGSGWNFYHAYYDNTSVGIQGGQSSGVIGVDYEFLEAALLFAAVPDAYFGLGTRADGTLTVSPAFPDGLDYWKMENLTYGGYYYDLSVGKYFAEISDVAEYKEGSAVAGTKAEISFRKPSFDFVIYLDGKQTSDYRTEGDRVIVTFAFRSAKVEIRERSSR